MSISQPVPRYLEFSRQRLQILPPNFMRVQTQCACVNVLILGQVFKWWQIWIMFVCWWEWSISKEWLDKVGENRGNVFNMFRKNFIWNIIYSTIMSLSLWWEHVNRDHSPFPWETYGVVGKQTVHRQAGQEPRWGHGLPFCAGSRERRSRRSGDEGQPELKCVLRA